MILAARPRARRRGRARPAPRSCRRRRTCGCADRLATTSAPAAPCAKAWSRKRWPSVVSPFSATNRSPGPTSRESKATPVDGEVADARRRRSRAAISARRSRAARHASRRASPARRVDVVERQHQVADDLALLVALAGDQHDVLRRPPRRSPRAIASRRSPISVAPGAPSSTSRADRGRVLAARIVVGDDHAVGVAAPRPAPISRACRCRGRRPRRTRRSAARRHAACSAAIAASSASGVWA